MISANKIYHRSNILMSKHEYNKTNHILSTCKLIYAQPDEIIWI